MENKLLCIVEGTKIVSEGLVILLLKMPIPAPFYKSADGMGMTGHLEKLIGSVVIVPVFDRGEAELFVDWPDSIPEQIRPKTILASDLSQVLFYEDGSVELGFGTN